MERRTIILKNHPSCSRCPDLPFLVGRPHTCPYLQKFIDAFENSEGWKRKVYQPAQTPDGAVSAVEYRFPISKDEFASVEASFTKVKTAYISSCSVNIKVKSSNEIKLIRSIEDIFKN